MDEPLPRQWFTDPTFNTCLVRVTDRGSDLSPGDPSTGLVNEYARVQSFNADESRLLGRGTDGTWYLYDAQTLGPPLAELPLAVEPRWDAQDPNLIYYSDETRLDVLPGKDGAAHGGPRVRQRLSRSKPGRRMDASRGPALPRHAATGA